MNNQNSINWSQLWYHIYGISDLKDQHRVTILKNYDPKLNTFSIPITWNFMELHLLRYEQTHSQIQKGRHWLDDNFHSFRKRYLPIKNRTMDRVIIFSNDHKNIGSNSYIISEAKRILTIDGRLTMIVKAISCEPDLELHKHLGRFGLSNIIVGHYIPAETSNAKESNIIIATATLQNVSRQATNGSHAKSLAESGF